MLRILFLANVLALNAWAATTYEVIPICCGSFSPSELNILVGDTVRWTPLSGHNVTETDSASSTTYNGGFQGSGASYEHIFNTPGTYYYLCTVPGHGTMRGTINVAAPSSPTPTATGSLTPSPTESPSPTPTDSPTISPTPTATDTPDTALSPTDSPTQSETFTVSPTATDTPSASVTATPTPSLTDSPTASPSLTHTEILTPTATPTLLVGSFAGVEEARLLASPITGGILRYWARLTGAAQQAELRVYSAAFTLLSVHPLGPQQAGTARWNLALPGLSSQPVWIQLRVQEDGRWRTGPVLRSYVLR